MYAIYIFINIINELLLKIINDELIKFHHFENLQAYCKIFIRTSLSNFNVILLIILIFDTIYFTIYMNILLNIKAIII